MLPRTTPANGAMSLVRQLIVDLWRNVVWSASALGFPNHSSSSPNFWFRLRTKSMDGSLGSRSRYGIPSDFFHGNSGSFSFFCFYYFYFLFYTWVRTRQLPGPGISAKLTAPNISFGPIVRKWPLKTPNVRIRSKIENTACGHP
jgi:hypothetical protein